MYINTPFLPNDYIMERLALDNDAVNHPIEYNLVYFHTEEDREEYFKTEFSIKGRPKDDTIETVFHIQTPIVIGYFTTEDDDDGDYNISYIMLEQMIVNFEEESKVVQDSVKLLQNIYNTINSHQ